MDDISKGSGLNGRIELDHHGKVVVLRMRRGQNKLNFSFFKSVNAALDEVEKSDAEVLVTTGDGKFYSNGIDLEYFRLVEENSKDIGLEFKQEFYRLISRVLTFPMVTIAALNGHAFAGGAFLTLAHDYRLMTSDRGWWCMNEVFMDMSPGPALTNFVKMKIPSGMPFHEALVLGQRFTSQRALHSGIVQMECERSQLIPQAIKLGERLTTSQPYPRKNLANMKAAVYKEVLDMFRQILLRKV